MSEKEWVKQKLQPMIADMIAGMKGLNVLTRKRLPYTSSVMKYDKDDQPEQEMQSYETDLLIAESFPDTSWLPRVVIETKLGSVTTHDAITYSQKAFAHKNVHPYLRYGILVGDLDGPLPWRLLAHGGHFDFITVWKGSEPAKTEKEQFDRIVLAEVEASRQLEALIRTRREKNRTRIYSLHRKLVLGN